ncbi:hypothetical protein KNLIENLN_00049 [Sinorhizobium phage NV1.1.1]|nr:hypothetical protein KNLIENLN_00049 [Sinorhizobium phage NV1.1.1]
MNVIDALFGGPVAVNDNSRKCERCASPFERRRPNQKFCSETCQKAHRDDKRRGDKDARNAKAPEWACEHCGEKFRRRKSSKDAVRFCSRDCGFAAKANVPWANSAASPEFEERARSLNVSYKVARCLCSQCGGRFSSGYISSAYCSAECRRLQYVVANDNLDRAPRQCADCGVSFSPEYGSKRRKFCSKECGDRHSRRALRKKERARLRGVKVETVDPIKVFDRDKWTCRICGVKTPRSLRGTYDPRAPELDHVMPLSLGGAHSYLNTQCACRKCNAAKSDTPPMQPSLFAYAA